MATHPRKLPDHTQDEVDANPSVLKAAEPTPAVAAGAMVEKAMRRRAMPIDAPLPRTFKWVAKLPREIQPIEVLRSFPRIANLLASAWKEPDSMHACLGELLVDRRGSRKGFPPKVLAELRALRSYYEHLHPASAVSPEDPGKRQ